MAYARKIKKRTTTNSKTYKRPRRTRKATPTFEKKVQRVLLSELETKKITTILGGASHASPLNITSSGLRDANYGVHIGNIWNTNNIKIEQGVQQDMRVGRTITNCKLYLKCCVQATFYNIATNTDQFPFEVYCIVYKDKQAPNTSVPDQLKLNTHGDATYISGEPTNLMFPFNKARYSIYCNKRIGVFKPMPQDRAEAVASNLQNPTIGDTSNKAFRYFSMKLPCPKTLEFLASSGSTASPLVSNAHLAIGFYVINGSGQALGNTQVRATIYPTATLYFKDA